jgi:hypothetical protein
MYSDCSPDLLKMTLLNVPSALVVLGTVFVLDYLTGFEITKALELPPPYGFAVVWGVVLPAIFVLSTALTNVVLRDGVVLKGKCPNCGTENTTYFGDIFIVAGNKGANLVDCPSCNASLTFDAGKRLIVVAETPEERAPKKAPAGPKKPAKPAA